MMYLVWILDAEIDQQTHALHVLELAAKMMV